MKTKIFFLIFCILFLFVNSIDVFACTDNDGDGYNVSETDCGTPDFDDSDKFIFPGAPEWCDGKDNDNDGNVDYVSTPGDLCIAKDCFNEICSMTIVWDAIWGNDYDVLNNYDVVISTSQNKNVGTGLDNIFLLYRSIIEATNYSGDYIGWDVVNSSDDWFFYNGSGERLKSLSFPVSSLMNLSNSDYIDWRVDQAGNISNYTNEGWFYDNFVSYDVYNRSLERWYNISTYYLTTGDDLYPSPQNGTFEDIMKNFAYETKKAMGDYLLIPNTKAYENYSEYLDGFIYEGWCFDEWDGWPAWYNEAKWQADMDLIENPSYDDKMFILMSEMDTFNQSIFDYCFSSYLLAKNTDTDLIIGLVNNEAATTPGENLEYYPIYDTLPGYIGSPVGDYYYEDNVYKRDFESGLVLVNPTRTNYTVNFSRYYKNLSNVSFNSTTLTEFQGLILVNASVCGNGELEPDEVCDDGNLENNDTCSDTCTLTICGDGILQDPNGNSESEECDGTDLDGLTCVDFSFDFGDLSCDSSCNFDTGDCANFTCGDSTCSSVVGETCATCAQDCGECSSGGGGGGSPAFFKGGGGGSSTGGGSGSANSCGDGVCSETESCETCSQDCECEVQGAEETSVASTEVPELVVDIATIFTKPPTQYESTQAEVAVFLGFINWMVILIIASLFFVILVYQHSPSFKRRRKVSRDMASIDKFVKHAKKKGFSDKKIRHELRKAGWVDDIVDHKMKK